VIVRLRDELWILFSTIFYKEYKDIIYPEIIRIEYLTEKEFHLKYMSKTYLEIKNF
jgi:hypothetical protein